MSLSCCSPTAYDGASRTTVHGPLCDKAEQPLTKAEMAEWIGHPVVSKGSHLRVVGVGEVDAGSGLASAEDPASPIPPKRKRRAIASERWFVGITPELEDFS